jgi:hypothetical protein
MKPLRDGLVLVGDSSRSKKGEAMLRTHMKQRCLTATREQCLAFCMARHGRLGSASPANVLVKDMFRFICGFVRSQEKLLIVGETGDFDVLDLNTGELVEMPHLPLNSLKGCFGTLHPNNKELFLFGGEVSLGTPNLDCFVFSFESNSWRCEENVFEDEEGRCHGSCVIYRNLVVCVGGLGSAEKKAGL